MTDTPGSFRLQFADGPLDGHERADQEFAPDEIPVADSSTHEYLIQGTPEEDPGRATRAQPVVFVARYAWVEKTG